MLCYPSLGLFGSGIALGTGESGLRGIFGSCQEHAKQNAANIGKLSGIPEFLTEDILKLRNEVKEKLLLGTTELAALKTVQTEMLDIQNCNWKLIEENFELFELNLHVLRDCDQLLFSRRQINFSYDTKSSLLAITFANIKSYRSALHTYRINKMNSIQPMLNDYLPMSLIPRQSLLTILNNVALEQGRQRDRLSLAIPLD